MRRGQLVGPYEGSLPDKALAYVEAGVNDIRQIAPLLDCTPYELRQAFRHLKARGYVEIHNDQIEVPHAIP